ncbi:LIM domain kinase 1 isoform X2 [Epargyreus clarus]|uniref:LIM domain kinase 1 isoform X2 n=1 Tax=Epargyreus clarus TaxID=520877 RepID=UPI003C2E439A
MEGSNTKETLSCAGCLNDIGDDDYVSALSQDWHKDCFRCSVCDAQLSTWYFEKGGLLFCQSDYWEQYGDICQQCAQVITGPVMAAGEHHFHPECFTCVSCHAHVEDGESYALLDRSQLYCGSCYSEAVRARRGSHAIRALRLPAAAFRLAAARTGGITLAQIESGCGGLTLHIGDRVLEVDGAPVRDRPLADIERALGDLVQLTIEHNPNTINAKRGPAERTSGEERGERGEDEGKRERFKRKNAAAGGRGCKRPQRALAPKERSSSMSKLLDVSTEEQEPSSVLGDLSRARSFRTEPSPGLKVFRASDLIQGELLGSGFFGQVYKVTHRATNEVMVLKQLYRVDEDAQKNFLKEVAVLRSLKHPNVLRFVGVLYRDKRLHLVTEYVAGGTLHKLLQDSGRALSWAVRSRLARGVAAGVGYLHRRNVIHRDLNSHNCLVRASQEGQLSVVVADFGLARIVQRTASSAPHATHSRKRYTVVGNPYWMAPEMMNGNVYDEKVDVFSFGIILCEIIGRVSADPDFLPRRSDFGLNEAAFVEKFCRACPEPFYRIAFLACHLDPDMRPPFEVIEIWLESLVAGGGAALLADVAQYARGAGGARSPGLRQGGGIFGRGRGAALRREPSHASGDWSGDAGVVKSQSNATICSLSGRESEDGVCAEPRGAALGKCVSAGHLAPRAGAGAGAGGLAAGAPLGRRAARSAHALAAPAGYILRADGPNINITKVDDITEWLDSPPPLKRSSPDCQLNHLPGDHPKFRKLEDELDGHLPAYLRNQSFEGLETKSKNEAEHPFPFCRHESIPNSGDIGRDANDSDSTDDDSCTSNLVDIVKMGGNILSKKASYDVTDVTLRHPDIQDNERNIDDSNPKRYNIDYHVGNSALIAEGVKNIPKMLEKPAEKPVEKHSNFFSKYLLSPKFKRQKHVQEDTRKDADENKDEKSKSKFFIQRPASPGIVRSSYRVRPVNDERKTNLDHDVLKSDLKLAGLGKPMTPIFRRHLPSEKSFADVRFSYRERRYEPKAERYVSRNRKAPVNVEKSKILRTTTNQPLAPVLEKKNVDVNLKEDGKDVKKREIGISKSNYVRLANLRISKQELGQVEKRDGTTRHDTSPVERVI